jgi:hypothetical protein
MAMFGFSGEAGGTKWHESSLTWLAQVSVFCYRQNTWADFN